MSTHSLLTVRSLNKHCQPVVLFAITGVLFDYNAARIEGRRGDKFQILYFLQTVLLFVEDRYC